MTTLVGEGGSSVITGEGGADILSEGLATVTGTGAGTLSLVTGAASGVVGVTGSSAATATRLTGSASGTFGVVGTAAGTLTLITGAASGTVDAGSGTPGEDEDHSNDPVVRIGGSGPKHVSGKPLGWRARKRKLLEEQRRAAETPAPVTGTAAGLLRGLGGQAIGVVGVAGEGTGTLSGVSGQAAGFTFDRIGVDNALLLLVA